VSVLWNARTTASVQKPSRPRRARRSTTTGLVAALLILCSCTSGTPSNEASSGASSIRGQHITVILPPWASVPDKLLKQFEDQTGVTVDFNVTGWDAIRDKISVAGAANSPLADVIEFDWSWTGQFGRSGWFVPLNPYLDQSLMADLQNRGAFSLNGDLYAACYTNDFRITAYNQTQFAKAGISTPPATFDQLTQDLETIKQKGVAQYPLSIPLAATEGTASVWELLTLAYGGNLFDEHWKPLFTSPDSAGYKALEFMISAVKAGLVDPGAISLSDEQTENLFRSGAASVYLPGSPSSLPTAIQSGIPGKPAFMLVPGASGPGNTFGLPEGLAIMASSEHKDAAAAFVRWWEEPETLIRLYKSIGTMPCRSSVLQTLSKQGKILGGNTIVQQLKYIVPLFPQGAPAWYTPFSTEAASDINAAAKGDISVAEALQRIAAKSEQLASQG
jgi:multiple sugar transport system substrate-binding protein